MFHTWTVNSTEKTTHQRAASFVLGHRAHPAGLVRGGGLQPGAGARREPGVRTVQSPISPAAAAAAHTQRVSFANIWQVQTPYHFLHTHKKSCKTFERAHFRSWSWKYNEPGAGNSAVHKFIISNTSCVQAAGAPPTSRDSFKPPPLCSHQQRTGNTSRKCCWLVGS